MQLENCASQTFSLVFGLRITRNSLQSDPKVRFFDTKVILCDPSVSLFDPFCNCRICISQEAYAEQVRARLEKQLRRRAKEMGYELIRLYRRPNPWRSCRRWKRSPWELELELVKCG